MSAQKDLPIKKLPKWAQEHIKNISRERDVAIRALNEFVDNQTPSSIFYDEWVCTGEEVGPSTKKKYIQYYKMSFEHAGVFLDVNLHSDDCIDLKWSVSGELNCREVAMIPTSFQNVRLVSKENMRS